MNIIIEFEKRSCLKIIRLSIVKKNLNDITKIFIECRAA